MKRLNTMILGLLRLLLFAVVMAMVSLLLVVAVAFLPFIVTAVSAGVLLFIYVLLKTIDGIFNPELYAEEMMYDLDATNTPNEILDAIHRALNASTRSSLRHDNKNEIAVRAFFYANGTGALIAFYFRGALDKVMTYNRNGKKQWRVVYETQGRTRGEVLYACAYDANGKEQLYS